KETGKSQSIVRWDEPTAESSKIEPPQAPAKTFTNQLREERPKKLEIIALDQINTPFASARDGSRALVGFLSKNVDANTLLALVTLEHNGVRIIHNFTSDPSVLVAAVNKVQQRLSSQDARALDASGENSQADLEALQLNAILSGTSPDLTNVNTSNPGNVAVAKARAASAQARAQVDASRRAQEALITLQDMQQLAQYFGAVPGRKSLIWASTG